MSGLQRIVWSRPVMWIGPVNLQELQMTWVTYFPMNRKTSLHDGPHRGRLGRVLTALLCVLQMGCASTDLANSRAAVAEAKPERDAILFGSIGTTVERSFESVSLKIRPAWQRSETLEIPFGYFDHAAFPVDFSKKDEKGVVAGIRVPPGDYEIHQIRVSWKDLWGAYSGTPEFPPIRVHVRKGEALYLGRFTATVVGFKQKKELIFTKGVPKSFSLDVRSEMEADLAELKTRGFASAGFHIRDGTDTTCGHPPLFRCSSALPPSANQKTSSSETP